MNHKQKTNIMNQEEILDNVIFNTLEVKEPGSRENDEDRIARLNLRLSMLNPKELNEAILKLNEDEWLEFDINIWLDSSIIE